MSNRQAKKNRITYQNLFLGCLLYIALSRLVDFEIVKNKLTDAGLLDLLDSAKKFFRNEYVFYVDLIFIFLLFGYLSESELIHKKIYIKNAEKRSKGKAWFIVLTFTLTILLLLFFSQNENPKLLYVELLLLILSYIFFADFIFSLPHLFPTWSQAINKLMITRSAKDDLDDFGYDKLSAREKIVNKKIVGHQDDHLFLFNKLHNGTTVFNGNPRRSNLIVGSAGSGKSVSILNPWIWQTLDKEVPMFLYDFKFPVQSKVALYRYVQLKKQNKDYPLNFHLHTFNQAFLHNIWRLSPINKVTVESAFHADVYINTLFSCMNKNWIKNPDFWSESTIAYGSAVTLAFKKYMEDKFTLPHILHFLSLDYMEQVRVLINLDDDQINAKIENIRKPVMENKGADQLSGIFSTMQNFVSKMHNAHIFFALSKPETTLDLNDPNAPTVLCVGNDNFYRKVFSPLISLYVSIVFSICNKQNKKPLHVMVDEAPTLYLPGVEDFINTGRSNGMMTTLGMQSKAQAVFEYGNELSRVIEGSLSNIYFGQVNDEQTQRYFSKMMGTYKKKSTSKNLQTGNGESLSFNEHVHVEHFLRAEEITRFDKGYFAGKVAEGTHTQFMGKVNVEEYLEHFEKSENLILPLSPTVSALKEDGSIKEEDIQKYYAGDVKAAESINSTVLKYADKIYADIQNDTKQFVNQLN